MSFKKRARLHKNNLLQQEFQITAKLLPLLIWFPFKKATHVNPKKTSICRTWKKKGFTGLTIIFKLPNPFSSEKMHAKLLYWTIHYGGNTLSKIIQNMTWRRLLKESFRIKNYKNFSLIIFELNIRERTRSSIAFSSSSTDSATSFSPFSTEKFFFLFFSAFSSLWLT